MGIIRVCYHNDKMVSAFVVRWSLRHALRIQMLGPSHPSFHLSHHHLSFSISHTQTLSLSLSLCPSVCLRHTHSCSLFPFSFFHSYFLPLLHLHYNNISLSKGKSGNVRSFNWKTTDNRNGQRFSTHLASQVDTARASATGWLLNIVVLPLNVMIFPNSASLATALVCYLPYLAV